MVLNRTEKGEIIGGEAAETLAPSLRHVSRLVTAEVDKQPNL